MHYVKEAKRLGIKSSCCVQQCAEKVSPASALRELRASRKREKHTWSKRGRGLLKNYILRLKKDRLINYPLRLKMGCVPQRAGQHQWCCHGVMVALEWWPWK